MNVLFIALVAVVVGSLAGEYLSIHGRLSDAASFYWGHQGWEYLDLGRVWQTGLFLGLLIWLHPGLCLRRSVRGAQARGESPRRLTSALQIGLPRLIAFRDPS